MTKPIDQQAVDEIFKVLKYAHECGTFREGFNSRKHAEQIWEQLKELIVKKYDQQGSYTISQLRGKD